MTAYDVRMAVNVLGRAYIEVHADTTPFAKELLADVTAVAKLAQKKAKTTGTQVGKTLSQAIHTQVAAAAPRTGNVFANAFSQSAGRRLRRGNIFQQFLGNATGIVGAAGKLGAQVGTSFASAFAGVAQSAGKGILGFVSSIGSSVANVGSAGPFATVAGFAVLLGIPALIGGVLSLISVLGPLLNGIALLPGALAIAGAAVIPVVAAFQDFGDAIGAVISGDPAAIAEAMKKLAPAARSVAKDFGKMMPFFRQLQDASQQTFFTQLLGVLPKVQKALEPILKVGFNQVTTSAGKFFANLLLLAENPSVKEFLTNVFSTTATIFDTLDPSIMHLLEALAAVGNATLPTIQLLSTEFGTMIDKFAGWLEESIKNGDFQKFMDDFIQALKDTKDLLISGANFIDSLFGDEAQQKNARQFFKEMIEMIDRLAAFFRSDEGKEALQGMIDLARLFLLSIEGIVVALGLMVWLLEKALDLIRAIAAVQQPWWAKLLGAEPGVLAKIGGSATPGRDLGAEPKGHAMGGIFNTEHLARIAEGGNPEVVIPLTDRRRAQELADQSGLSQMIGAPQQAVNVYIGDEQIEARVDRRVALGIKGLTKSMKYVPRPIGVGG